MNNVTSARVMTASYSRTTVSVTQADATGKTFTDELSGITGKTPEPESFEDMYFPADYDSQDSAEEFFRKTDHETHYVMSLSENALLDFMEMAREEFKKGKSLEDVVNMQNQMDVEKCEYKLNWSKIDSTCADQFYIDKKTGEISFACPKHRGVCNYDIEAIRWDEKNVHNIADDLNTFLRYASTINENPDPERVERLFEYIKDKQKNYSVTRYDPAYARFQNADGYIAIPEITAGEKEALKEKEKEGEAIDDLIETLRIHQEQMNARKENRPVSEAREELLRSELDEIKEAAV